MLEQAVLAEFISSGHMEQHMRHMRELYTTRLQALTETVRREIPDVMELAPIRSGLQTVGWLPKGMDDVEACRAAFAQRIYCAPLSRITIDRTLPPAMVLFPAATDVRTIRRSVEQLGEILRTLRRGQAAAASG